MSALNRNRQALQDYRTSSVNLKSNRFCFSASLEQFNLGRLGLLRVLPHPLVQRTSLPAGCNPMPDRLVGGVEAPGPRQC